MGKLFHEYFHIPKNGKIRDKVIIGRLVVTVVATLVCLIVMGLSAYAYFTHDVISANNVIKAANFETNVKIQITDENGEAIQVITSNYKSHLAELKANTKYFITLNPTERSTAQTGFVVVSAEGCDKTYHTQQLGVDGDITRDQITFCLVLGEDTKVTLRSHWGTSSYYGYNSDSEQYIFQGETVLIPVNGTVPSVSDENVIEDVETLQKKYQFSYYANATEAMTQINDGKIGQNQTATKEDANVGTYIDGKGNKWLVFLKDQTVTSRLTPYVSMNVNLGGFTIDCTATTFLAVPPLSSIPSGNPIKVVIEGRGSTVESTIRPIECWDGNVMVINGGTYIGWTSVYGKNSESFGILNRGVMALNDVHSIGLSAGLMINGAEITYINGGLYQGYSHGGIYFGGTGTTTYAKDATIEQIGVLDGYTNNGMTQGVQGAYIGGGSGKDNIVVYMDNCTIKPLSGSGAFKFRDTSGEKNNTVYMSNMKIMGSTYVTLTPTHHLYIGTGCPEVKYDSKYSDLVVYTNEVYRFAHDSTLSEVLHTVVAGENLTKIANKYNTTMIRIAAYNNITDPNKIQIGSTLKIPPSDWEMPEDYTLPVVPTTPTTTEPTTEG